MSKPVKQLLRKELVKRLEGVRSLAVVGFTGIDAVRTRQIRGRLRGKQVRLMVVKNSIARQAFSDMGLDPEGLFDGPCALAYGAEGEQVDVVSIVRELLEIGRETPELTVKAALLSGEVFGGDRVEELRKYPTRDEAMSRLSCCVLSAGANLAGCLTGPAGKLAGILKSIEEKHTEGGPASEAAA